MKKFFLATTAALALAAGSAGAADMSRPAYKAAPMAPPCAAAQFQGGYVGVSGGGVYHDAGRADADGFLTDNSGYRFQKWGGIVGAQAGYNWTTCSTLWGIEVDGSWVGVKNEFVDNPNAADPNRITSRMDALVTARVRTGVALDNLLLYVTGGVAGARFRTTWEDLPDTVEFKEWRWGWTAGFGTEWAWTPNVSLKSEVLYAAFTDRDVNFNFVNFGPATFRHNDSVWVSRVGLNVRWGAPVVAKY